jgi:membrane-associated phospholipid phosphatase/predicted MFS family arabinose efflux permease
VSVMAHAIARPAPRAAAAALWAFVTVAVALGAARAVTTTYVPVLLERIADRPGLIGAVMLVNAAAGFVVPLAAGLWSDRRGTRAPFILGGSLVGAGGLVAVALGNASSYAVLALAAATVYIGLNAASTAHRALVAERFAADRRAAATGAQEGAMLAGALAGTLAGGALIDGSPAALFTLWAILLPLLALPTLAWQRAAAPVESTAAAPEPEGSTVRLLLEVLRRDGARHVLIAQVLWVASYAALAPFMVLYAEDVLGLTAAAAGAVLAGFGVLTGLGMLAGARMAAGRLHTTLLTGVTLLGGGLLAGTAASNLAQGAVPFAAAALGAGLVSAVGFPYFTRFVPGGQEGRYAGAFFSARAIATTAALPTAGLLIAATGSYRALLGMGALGLAALVPLARAERRAAPEAGEIAVPASANVVAAAGEVGARVLAADAHSGEIVADARLGDFIAGRREGEFVAGARAGEYVDEARDGAATGDDAGARPPIRRLAAVMPVFRSERAGAVAEATLAHVDQLVLVDDGAPRNIAAMLDDLARDPRVRVVRPGGNRGKGAAVAAGIEAALEHAPDAVVVLDSDGQHPPELIPAFARAAATADVVIGDRPRAGAMPRVRRVSNALSSWALSLVVRRRLRDTQNGMRLFRADALRDVRPPHGRYEAETRHLKALIRGGHDVAWVPMPAIYGGEPSSFRPVADGLLVARAILARPENGPRAAKAATPVAAIASGSRATAPAPEVPVSTLAAVAREWAPRIGLGMLLAWAVAAALPLLGPLDERLFLAVNDLGDGPEWLYQALDPHSRNYLLLAASATLAVLAATRRLRFAGGALLAMAFAGVFSDLVLELIQLGVDRPRPEEALGADVQRSHDRHWSHIPSFPSGHLIVTTAMVATAMAMAPVLRAPLLVYLAAVAVTRITFGAHFPLDVAIGAIVGWQVGLATAALIRAARLLPPAPAPLAQPGTGAAVPEPAPA